MTYDAAVKMPTKLAHVFSGPARYRGAHGGRGSGKSFTFAKMAAVRGYQSRHRILCVRELQSTLRDSAMSEVIRAIDTEPWLGAHYEYGESFVRGKNGTEFIFRGVRHNAREIKSLTGVTIVWAEEAEAISEPSYRALIPTIREPGSEIWATWNPESSDSATNARFRKRPPKGAKIAEINWRDNPWFPAELEAERQYDLQGDPDMYRHVWEGDYITRTDAQVLAGKWVLGTFDQREGWDGPYYGADWGFSRDPTALVRCWICGRTLYIDFEAVGVGVALDDTPDLFLRVPGSKENTIRADSARPETINHLVRRGWKVVAAPKWPGSVEDGVEYLRSFVRIVIHERCTHTAREARLWSFKVDRNTEDVLPVMQPGNDHCWDAVRYALAPMIQKRPRVSYAGSISRITA